MTSAAGLKIVGPDLQSKDPQSFGRLRDEGGSALWQWPSPDRPGVYRIERDGQAVFALALGVSADESPLESLSPDLLKQAIGRWPADLLSRSRRRRRASRRPMEMVRHGLPRLHARRTGRTTGISHLI